MVTDIHAPAEVSPMSWWSRLVNVFQAGRVERELDEEFQFHIDERIEELTAAGMTPAAAAAEVRRRFGSPLHLREQSRDIKLLPWLDSMVRDVRLGARMLRRDAIVTCAAVVSLSLALGACIAGFSLVDALILRPLPVRNPAQLIYLTFPTYAAERPEADGFNDPTFVHLREASRGRVDLFAMSTHVIRPVIVAGAAGEKERVRTQFVSGDAFEILGVLPAAGRVLTPRDDGRPGAAPVAVLSHRFWTRRFDSDPAVIGRWLVLEGRQFQIVGIADPRFMGVEPGRPTDLWVPYAMYDQDAFGNFGHNWFRIIGRVRENVGREEAQRVLQTAFTGLRRSFAERSGAGRPPEEVARFVNTPLHVRSAATGPSPVRRQFERPLWILASIAALILLIAGSNVANLFLARTAAREREMALRLSIGAGRGRLIQQVLVESVLVTGAASICGLFFAAIAAPAVVGTLAPPENPVHLELGLDWRLVSFAGVVALLATALFGLVPALRASSTAPLTTLKTSGAHAGAAAGVMRPFVVIQVGFGLLVLFVGSLLVLSFAKLSSVHPGFATSDVLLLSLEAVQPVDAKQQRTALLQTLDRLGAVPGVQAVSSAEFNALGRAWTHTVQRPGAPQEAVEATMAPVTPGYFETMRIPLVAGRTFEARDLETHNSTAMVVNEAFASDYFGGEPAVGRTLEGRFDDAVARHEIVGVVADTRYDLRKPAAPTLYVLLPLRTTGTVHVRVAGDPDALPARLREEVRAATPLFRVTTIRSQAEVVGQTLLRERLLALLSGFFAIVGLVLAAVGLYGVLSYSVVQRTREIGIRVALGAHPLGVVQMVVADAGGAALVGVACGLAGGVYGSRFVEALLFEVAPLDVWSLALPLGVCLIAGLLAAALPAWRAARVDPVIALRYE